MVFGMRDELFLRIFYRDVLSHSDGGYVHTENKAHKSQPNFVGSGRSLVPVIENSSILLI
jgi:hypothetical protein